MISALHLFWIVPVAAFMGFVMCSLLAASEEPGEEKDEGQMMAQIDE